MFRPLVALSALAFIATPAAAATYSATAPAAQGKFAARDILWTCGSGACTGSTENSRPLVLCQGLAKQAGRIESFNVNGQAISGDDLARCNSVVKAGDRNSAVANAR